MKKDKSKAQSLEVQLFEERGETSRFIRARVEKNGDLVVLGQDVGKAPQECWGDGDYEFWVIVPNEHKDEVLLALIDRVYGGNFRAVDEFREFLDSKGIHFKWMTWA